MWLRLALLAACALLVAGCGGSGGATDVAQTTASRFDGVELNPPERAPAISLRDENGRKLVLSALRGKTVFVTFLYTHCPDVCPLIATHLDTVLRGLAPATRRNVRVLAVSVDPKGDTPAAAKRFVAQHDLLPQFHFLLGTRQELSRVWKAYHVAAGPGPEDTVNHSAYTLLVDAHGNERVVYDAQVRPADVLHDLRVLHAG